MNWKLQINLMVFAQLIIITCMDMSDPYWPLIIQRFNPGFSEQQVQFWSAAIYIVPFLITIVSIPLWGYLGEKIGHKKMLLRASVALVLTQMLIGFLTNPYWILIVRLLQGLFAGFSAAGQAWAIRFSSSESHSHIIGRLQGATAIGTILGPLFGGVIAHYLGYPSIFFISALICGMIVLLLKVYLQETSSNQFFRKAMSIKNLWLIHKNILYLLLLICFTQAARWMSSSYFALYAVELLHGNNLTVGILYSGIALAIFLSAPQWGCAVDKKIKNDTYINGIFSSTLLVAGLTQYLFAFSANFYLALLASLIWGICLGAISLIPFTLLIKESNGQHTGTLIGFGNSASKLGNLIGVALGAFIQANSNFTYSFISIGILYTILAAILLLIQYHSQRVSVTHEYLKN